MLNPERSNPTTAEQVDRDQRKKEEETVAAINSFFEEVEENPRELTPLEVVFLQKRLGEIDEELSKPHEETEPGELKRDQLAQEADKIREILQEQE